MSGRIVDLHSPRQRTVSVWAQQTDQIIQLVLV
jgi:hypothetical protein